MLVAMEFSRRPVCVAAVSLSVVLLGACATSRAPAARASAPRALPTFAAQPGRIGGGGGGPRLYSAEEALRDALSGPLEHLGTGSWPGNRRMAACAFRNERVIVVNAYCSVRDTQAFRVEVYSPTRGRVRIYAESEAPVSGHVRQQYFSFTAESEPPPSPGAPVPALGLGMTFEDLQRYDEQRYNAFLPACYGGTELHKPRSGCLGPLAPEAPRWSAEHSHFLEHANSDWYRVVSTLRRLSERYGREPQ
jgi:hypothetical protein